METLQIILGVVSGVIIAPLTNWLKLKIPNFPIKPVAISYILAFLATWGLAQWLSPDLAMETIVILALGIVGTSAQITHEAFLKKK